MAETLAWRCFAMPLLEGTLATLARMPLGAVDRLAGVLCVLLWPLLRSRRRVIATNLELCFPELDAAARKQLLRANVRSTLRGFLELAIAYWRPSHAMQGWLDIEGLEHLHAALQQGKGVLLLCGHFHCMELAARLMMERLGQPMHMMARPLSHVCLQAMVDRRRRSFCEQTLDKSRPAGLLRSLKKGHPVGYAADQNFTHSMIFVPFFGHSAATVTGASRISRSAGCPVITMWYHRSADGRRYKVILEPPLKNFPSDDADADTARWMAMLETRVRQHPEQYLWAHRRFRTQPGAAVAIYDSLRGKHRRG